MVCNSTWAEILTPNFEKAPDKAVKTVLIRWKMNPQAVAAGKLLFGGSLRGMPRGRLPRVAGRVQAYEFSEVLKASPGTLFWLADQRGGEKENACVVQVAGTATLAVGALLEVARSSGKKHSTDGASKP